MPKVDMRKADFVRCAQIETKMWRAYYNHHFIKPAFYLLVSMRTAFQCSWVSSARLAWYGGKAALIYRLQKGHENYPRILKNLVKFYKVGSDHSVEPFDYHKAAELELEWWDIHRYPEKYDKSLEQSIAEAAAVVYHCQPKDLREYASYRAQAAGMLTHESDKYPEKNDWPKIDDLLYKTWQSFSEAVRSPIKTRP
ncbi:MAG TPA: hypothetical protein VLE51_02705 [Candidatus Saccharimonadales bacterium]|nr:hypothetical protein [Candidatus Saccharimonadales bacterium]